MRILLVGSGAREHAIAKVLSKSSHNPEIYCFGSNNNPGIQSLSSDYQVGSLSRNQEIGAFVNNKNIQFAVIGPEGPLAEGLADYLSTLNIPSVGPKKALAQIESSKGFTRSLLKKYNIPGNPAFKQFYTMEGVAEFLKSQGDKYVVKYDGLMGGKGVKVAGEHLHSHAEAIEYCQSLVMKNGSFVIEEKLVGEEFSLMSFCDGEHLIHMPAVQDHKRAYVGDTGPNTGGMGTYSDANHALPFLNNEDIETAQTMNKLTAQALKKEFGDGYKGILYGGFMVTIFGVKLIEYNARFGDPEAMNILCLLKSDFVDICNGIIHGNLDQVQVEFESKASVCKYAVPNGYPDSPVKDEIINVSAVKNMDNLFYASVDVKNGQLVEAGSRTIAVVGISDTIAEAEMAAEKEISSVTGPLFHRKDIGTRELVQKRIDHMDTLREVII